MTTTRIDYRRENKELYHATTRPTALDVPELCFLAVDGEGDPRDPRFATAVTALCTAAYALKFALRAETGTDYGVLPLEGLWHHTDRYADLTGGDAGAFRDRSGWRWTLLIRQPLPFTDGQLAAAREKAAAKAGEEPAAALRTERFAEGRCVQLLHKGTFETEPETVARLHRYLAEGELTPSGRHHELYLTDHTRTAPERQRTLLRQPVLDT
ncbi:GyrI-like domain-containing protein [Streptomyces sp. NPDC048182]|uniref:GyrI-like domain-containing protein n=1 Tax=unclassified Streptomyces TaxID=2593676 RepID=UPI0033A87E13